MAIENPKYFDISIKNYKQVVFVLDIGFGLSTGELYIFLLQNFLMVFAKMLN